MRRNQAAWSRVVISGLTDSVLATFIVFCRIGACLMLVPGFSSVNIPAQIRLFVAIVSTLSVSRCRRRRSA